MNNICLFKKLHPEASLFTIIFNIPFYFLICILFLFYFLIYIDHIIPLISLQPLNSSFTPYSLPNIIWLFWDGHIPDSNRYFLHNLKEKLNNYNLVFLCNTTVFNYVDIKRIPPNLYTIKKANQVDYYRFCLLYCYGGVWLDCSTYLSGNSFVNSFIDRMRNKESLMGGFNFIHHPNYHIEVGIIFAPRKSPFIRNIVKEMDLSMKIGRKTYMRKRINEGVIVKSPFIVERNKEEVIYKEYLCVYVSILTVLQKYYNNDANIELLKAEDYMYKLHDLCHWNNTCMKRLWEEVEETKQYPVTKFNHLNRDLINFPKVDII